MSDLTPEGDNTFRTRAQARKAAAIVAWIRSRSILAVVGEPPEGLAQIIAGIIDRDAWWQAAAESAGVNATEPPSMTTRSMVLGLLDTAPALKMPEVSR